MTLPHLLFPLLVLMLPVSTRHSPAALPATMDTASPLHFTLERSSPAADSTVHMPKEVSLWFSEVPQKGSTSIRVQDAAEKNVPMGDVVSDAATPKVLSAAFRTSPGAGRYTVAWRAMGPDGHVMKGEFSFSVMAHNELR